MENKVLYLLIDTSSSMWDVDGKTGKIKIDLLKSKLLNLLRDRINDFESIELYTFASILEYKGTVKSIDELERMMNFSASSGSTRIWDSINELVDRIFNDKNIFQVILEVIENELTDSKLYITILCVTDGEDNASSITFDELMSKIEGIENLELKIIDLSDSINKIKKIKAKNITFGGEEDMENILDSIKKPVDYEFSVSVFPVIQVEMKELDLVRRMILKAVPYIENLTGLRYYPVPTFIVDDYIIRDYVDIRVIDDSDTGEISLEDIKEFLRFIWAVSLSFHTCSFIPEELAVMFSQTRYGGLHDLSEKAIWRLRAFAEGMYSLCHILYGDYKKFFEEGDDIYIPEISSVKDPIINSYDDLKYMEKILQNIYDKYGEEVYLDDGYFGRTRFNSDIWRRYVSPSQFRRLTECVDEYGHWRRDLRSIIYVLDIAIDIVFNFLQRLRKKAVKYYQIVSNIHTFGVYLHPKDVMDEQLRNKLISYGYPQHFLIGKTGAVLLSLDRIKDRIEQCLKESNLVDADDMKEKLILATVIHEHTHAAIYEGLNYNSSNPIFSQQYNNEREFKAVSEGLAEWAELNYFRNDSVIFDIIFNHASSGDFPYWPYSSALLIENSYKSLGDVKYRALVEYFRKDYEEAYKLLIEGLDLSYLQGIPSFINNGREKFLSSLDPKAREIFGKVLDFAEENGLPIHWGTIGFSINAKTYGGRHINILHGYPENSSYSYNVLKTTFGEIIKKAQNGEDVVEYYKQRLSRLRSFFPKGNNMMCIVENLESELDEFLEILSSVASTIR